MRLRKQAGEFSDVLMSKTISECLLVQKLWDELVVALPSGLGFWMCGFAIPFSGQSHLAPGLPSCIGPHFWAIR